MKLRFGSVCSGIEAASVAWSGLGWEAAWFSEIEKFPCELLAHHYPNVKNLGDMTTIADRIISGEVEAPDILCGGTPCQAFSVAGLRKSLDDARGNLSLEFVRLFDAIDTIRTSAGLPPAICFWENVPGALNTKDNFFGCFLAGLAKADAPFEIKDNKWGGAGMVQQGKRQIAWRVLDAQHFGVPQRRRRVYVVASAREGFDPSKILFERTSLSGNSKQSIETRKGTPYFAETGFAKYSESKTSGSLKASGGNAGLGGDGTLVYAKGGDVCDCVTSKWAKGSGGPSGSECGNMVIKPCAGDGKQVTGCLTAHDLEQQVTSQTGGGSSSLPKTVGTLTACDLLKRVNNQCVDSDLLIIK